MIPLNPQVPYVFPEPRALEEIGGYEHQPPFSQLALEAKAVFGITSALTAKGVDALNSWLERNPNLSARLILLVYPACATRQADLSRLLDVVTRTSDRVSVRIRLLERVTDRGANALCFVDQRSDAAIVAGPSEDLGLELPTDGCVNFVFRAVPTLVESFRRYFDWLWENSLDITAQVAVRIPELILPEGTEEAAQIWQDYMSACSDVVPLKGTLGAVAHIEPDTGEITIMSEDGKEVITPTEEIGIPKLDPLAERIARLYEKGHLVSIDKLTRIPPLDAPLDPSLFGDVPEFHKGNITRKVSMRVSIIDESTLKEIENRRHGLRTLLTKFTFGLADNMRWMPVTARKLFESEFQRISEEGQNLISNLLKGDIDQFVKAKRQMVAADINGMYTELGKPGQVTDDIVDKVVESLKNRLDKARSADFLPKLSYSGISFPCAENAVASPWGQASSLLIDIATFPRKALTDSFFFRGLKVDDDDLIEAMNVAEDALCRDLGTRGIKDRCRMELDLLSRIVKASMEARNRCELVWQILAGVPLKEIEMGLAEKASK